jgi:hypothetical protein
MCVPTSFCGLETVNLLWEGEIGIIGGMVFDHSG